jgi:acyl-coenzyme A thioesterase PaaI-like protein
MGYEDQMDFVPHPGDLDRHIMLDLGFGVGSTAQEMQGSGHVVPEMFVPGTKALRLSILAAWADITSGYLAMGLFDPGVPVTLDLDVHLHSPVVDVDEVSMIGRIQKSGRSVSVLTIEIFGDGDPFGFAHATFMASPNPELRMPTVVSDEGLVHLHPPRLEVSFAERAGCERLTPGLASIPMRPDGLNASGTLNGGLLALVVEEAALSCEPGHTLASLSMRYAQPVRVGPAVAQAEVRDGLGSIIVRDAGRDDRLAVIASTRSFS